MRENLSLWTTQHIPFFSYAYDVVWCVFEIIHKIFEWCPALRVDEKFYSRRMILSKQESHFKKNLNDFEYFSSYTT